MARRSKLAVFKFASCDGCQLSFLALEDELLAVAEKLDIAYFLEATSRIEGGPYDVALVEGSITTADDAQRIRQVRRNSKYLVTIGACATAGGIQALRNWADSAEFLRAVYARPEYIQTLATSTAISDHVPVDFQLRGCPINKYQLLEVLVSLLAGRRPKLPEHSVCLDCKRRGTVCVMVAQGIPCLGPVTHTGCGAICPSYDRGCYGCYGPCEQPNLVSISNQFQASGVATEAVVRGLRDSFNGYAPEFRTEGDRLAQSIKKQHLMADARTIQVKVMTRVEGAGGLRIRLRKDRVEEVQLKIFEAPRLFEAFLRGRALEEVPDITARICGICPVAYQMSSVHALEAALGISVSAEVRRLRRLLYCGEWIESHALHVHLLHVPDFLGYASGLEMVKDHPAEFKRGLRLKKHGNQLLDVLGGRAVHPINAAVGGFYRLPRREELAALVADFQWGLKAAVEATRWIAAFDFPDFEQPYDFVALSHPDEYPLCEGKITSSDGLSIEASQFEQFFRENQVPHSTALQAVRVDTGRTYFVGALARLNLNREKLFPTARKLADEIGLEHPCRNPFKSILARCLEIVHAYEEALSIMETYQPVGPPRVPYEYRSGQGSAATEAPRGLLYHSYSVDAQGKVTKANIIPPTSQNQSRIEDDLRSYVPQVLRQSDEQIALACERLVRSYDPCISCSTHFLKVTLERR